MTTLALTLRSAQAEDAELLLRWRNDPSVRSQSFDSLEIEAETHARWFAGKLAAVDTRIYVGELDGRPVGQARIDRRDDATGEISVSVDPDDRGRGVGPALIASATRRGADELGLSLVLATIKEGNEASQRAFRRAGYTDERLEHNGEDGDVVVLVWRR